MVLWGLKAKGGLVLPRPELRPWTLLSITVWVYRRQQFTPGPPNSNPFSIPMVQCSRGRKRNSKASKQTHRVWQRTAQTPKYTPPPSQGSPQSHLCFQPGCPLGGVLLPEVRMALGPGVKHDPLSVPHKCPRGTTPWDGLRKKSRSGSSRGRSPHRRLAIRLLFRPIPRHFSRWGAKREAAMLRLQLGQTHSLLFH